jgi:NAD(P)-dependent dehydrogenase (short-subunit alcohol dehydrogenase family)/rhamnose utilization protein RhaD (predicted bifunctional aldolase and dehydrogenase)
MIDLWDEAEAAQFDGETGQLRYVIKLIDQEPGLISVDTGAGFSLTGSLKKQVANLFGEMEEILVITTGRSDSAVDEEGLTLTLRREPLQKLAGLPSLSTAQLTKALAGCKLEASAFLATGDADVNLFSNPRPELSTNLPPLESLLHAVLPFKVIIPALPLAVLALGCTPHGRDRLTQIMGKEIPVVPYALPGLPLAQTGLQALEGLEPSIVQGMIFLNYGLLVFGETPRQAYANLVELVNRCELAVSRATVPTMPASAPPTSSIRQELAALRQSISGYAGRPLIMTCRRDQAILGSLHTSDLPNLARTSPALAGSMALTRLYPLVGKEVKDYIENYAQTYLGVSAEAIQQQIAPPADLTPRIVLDPDLGLCALGGSAAEARQAESLFQANLAIAQRARVIEAFQSLPISALLAAETVSLEERHLADGFAFQAYERSEFQGEIALVTGGASGIGKACVAALRAHGAAVVSLDINPAVTTCFESPEYLGLVCDLTDEASIIEAFETFTQAFGGLDMLVLNAGVFPAGCRIESLSLAEWQRVMRINLDSNLVLLREAHPLLKHSPKGGRVLVNASKNVLAPGAGAAAYSASKAAVTQMARVAALEWGKDHIRVNMIHPDAIFDTGIWTEPVIQARAAHYGLTVQQYKTRNILGVELNSHYVAELVVDMLGPRFEKITGAQIPVDGGSDRVI